MLYYGSTADKYEISKISEMTEGEKESVKEELMETLKDIRNDRMVYGLQSGAFVAGRSALVVGCLCLLGSFIMPLTHIADFSPGLLLAGGLTAGIGGAAAGDDLKEGKDNFKARVEAVKELSRNAKKIKKVLKEIKKSEKSDKR